MLELFELKWILMGFECFLLFISWGKKYFDTKSNNIVALCRNHIIDVVISLFSKNLNDY